MKILLRILKWLAVVFVALVIVMLAINWSDQPPSPAAVEMRSFLNEGPEVPDEENAFVYAMGFAAPQGDDPIHSGQECIAKLNAAVHKQTINFKTDLECWDYSSSKNNNAAISKILEVCGTPDKACEDALKKNEQVIVQWLNDDGWLLDRYAELLNRSKWRSTTEFSLYMPFPNYEAVGNVQKMLLFKAWHLAGQGKSAEVQTLLNRDARFWRTVMSSSSTLVDKMVATAYLARHFSLSNLVLRRLYANGFTSTVPDEWLIQIEGDELSLKRVMAGEWAFLVSALQEAKVHRTLLLDESDISAPEEGTLVDEWLEDASSYFLLPQATHNAHAEFLLNLVNILDVPVRHLPQALQQADAYMSELASVGNLLHPYNPIGSVLVAISAPAYSGYAERVYNLEGVRRAALAATQLRENGVGENQVASALSRTDLRNPYDEKPFEWNAETFSIIFKGLGSDERNTHSFLY